MNILAVGAHFDDVELGCAGSLAKHVKRGDRVFVFVASNSGYGTYGGNSIRSCDVARAEGKCAADVIGAELICGDQRTFYVEFNEKTNVEIIKIVEEKRIDCVYTHWDGDAHHDHYCLAKAVLHATRHIPRVLQYKSNWYSGSETFRENFFVDISETWDIKRKAILCHESEHKRVGNKWLDYFDRESLNNGLKIGVERAESFQVIKWVI